jgi:hypothetical protein
MNPEMDKKPFSVSCLVTIITLLADELNEL